MNSHHYTQYMSLALDMIHTDEQSVIIASSHNTCTTKTTDIIDITGSITIYHLHDFTHCWVTIKIVPATSTQNTLSELNTQHTVRAQHPTHCQNSTPNTLSELNTKHTVRAQHCRSSDTNILSELNTEHTVRAQHQTHCQSSTLSELRHQHTIRTQHRTHCQSSTPNTL